MEKQTLANSLQQSPPFLAGLFCYLKLSLTAKYGVWHG